MRGLFNLTILILFLSVVGVAQSIELTNNPFTPNPRVASPISNGVAEVVSYASVERDRSGVVASVARNPISAQTTSLVSETKITAPVRPDDPTEFYLVGVGDILFVSIENVPTSRGYYSVRNDGTVDLPILGETIDAAGKTAAEIAFSISQKSKVFAGRPVEVKVREYASHKITVSGLVERSGDRFLQREAIPFYVIRAGSGVDQKATHVIIRRDAASVPDVIELKDRRLDEMKVTAGSSFEFVAESANAMTVAVYITGDVGRSGKYSLTNERNLAQLIAAAGGVKNDAAKITVRRPGKNGSFTSQQYDLKAIRKGTQADPMLFDGDIVEVKK